MISFLFDKKILTIALFLIGFGTTNAQVHCGLVEIVPNSSVNANMAFEDFSTYAGGYVLNAVARIKVRVDDKLVVDPLCSWSLIMTIDNNPGAGTPVNEWEVLNHYGTGLGTNPPIDMLEIRVRNNCATSPINGVFTTFTNNMDVIDIIAPLLPVTPAGTCAVNTNGAGSYLTNYDEFTFAIDVRVKPGYIYNPGIYQLNIRFRLEENI